MRLAVARDSSSVSDCTRTSVNVAIGGETSVTVAAVDNKRLSAPTVAVSAPCNQAAVRK